MISRSRHARISKAAGALLLGTVVTAMLLVPLPLAAEPEIEVRGNRVLSTGHIHSLTRDMAWDSGGDGAVLHDIQEAYIREGYLFASIRVERSPKDSIIALVIDEGEVARIGRIEIRGASRFGEDAVRDALNAHEGERFQPAAVDEGVKALLEMYDAQGFPFAQIWVDSLQLDTVTSRVGFSVHVVEGGSRQLSRVRVEGLEKTKENIAIKLSGLRTGEPYDGDSVRDAYLRLSASGVFDDVVYPAIQMSPTGDGVEALIKVVEPKRSNSFTAALGYAERQGGNDNILSGVVRLDLLNIGGTLRDLNLLWRNDGAGKIETALAFHQRFFFGRRMSLGLTLQQVGQDTIYTWQSLGVEAGLPIGRLGRGMFGVDLAVHGDRNTFAQGEVANSLRYRLTGGYSYTWGRKHRDTLFDLSNRYTFASKQMRHRDALPDRSVTQLIIEARLRGAIELGRRFHLTNETVLRTLSSDEAVVPLSEQFYIGGAGTVRGYREDQFHSRHVAFSRSELLVGKSRAENGYVFFDIGYFEQRGVVPTPAPLSSSRVIAGYGFGLRTQSRAGNVDISFAVGDEMSIRQTKVHLILNRSF